MTYQITPKTTEWTTSTNLYQPSQRGTYKTMIKGGVALLLISTLPSTAFAIQSTMHDYSTFDKKTNIIGAKVNIDNQHRLVVPLRKDLRESQNFDVLQKSFSLHFEDTVEEAPYYSAFFPIAEALKSLYIKKSFVDINKRTKLIDFTINLGSHIILTVGKKLQSHDDGNVMFTLSYRGDLEIADMMPLDELIKKIDNIQTTLTEREL